MKFKASVGILGCVLSLAAQADVEVEKSVFGPDDRHIADQSQLPYRAVVHLFMPMGDAGTREATQFGECTATLVGPRLLLTNAHCVEMVVTGLGRRGMRRGFQQTRPLFIHGPLVSRAQMALDRFPVHVVSVGTSTPMFRAGDDYAFLEAEQDLGAIFGFIPLSQELNRASFPQGGLMMGGFSSDWAQRTGGRFLPAQENCSIVDRRGSEFIHDCDSAAGSSGSAMVRCDGPGINCRVVALNHAEIRGSRGFAQYSQDSVYALGNRAVVISDEIFQEWQRLSGGQPAVEAPRAPGFAPGVGYPPKPGEGVKEEFKNVFGDDDRADQNHSQAPYSSVVRVQVYYNRNSNDLCTGTLIDRDLVLTNAHCVTHAMPSFQPMAFVAGRIPEVNGAIEIQVFNRLFRRNIQSIGASVVAFGPTQVNYAHDEDWAILKLFSPAPESAGAMPLSLELESLSAGIPMSGIILAGHSADLDRGSRQLNLPAHVGCSIVDHVGEFYYHNCDSTRGSSGSPLIRCEENGTGCRVVALHARQIMLENSGREQFTPAFQRDRANVAISLLPVVQAFELLKIR